MTSLPVELLLYIKSFPEQSRIILLLPYKILERFFDKYRSSANFKKGPRFFETPCTQVSDSGPLGPLVVDGLLQDYMKMKVMRDNPATPGGDSCCKCLTKLTKAFRP